MLQKVMEETEKTCRLHTFFRSSLKSFTKIETSRITFDWRFSATTSCCPAKSQTSFITCLNALQGLYLKQRKDMLYKCTGNYLHGIEFFFRI